MIVAWAALAWAEDGRPSGLWVDAGASAQVGQWQSLRRGWSFAVKPLLDGRVGLGAVFAEGRVTTGDGLVLGLGRLGVRPIHYRAVGLYGAFEVTTVGFVQRYVGVDVDVPGVRRLVATAEAVLDDSAPFAVGTNLGVRWRVW